MQHSTVFSILMVLINKRKVTREYLAQRFSISTRTVSRCLNALEDAGVPICSLSGKGGGVTLDENYMLDKSFITEAEAIRLKAALDSTADDYDDNVNRALAEKLDAVNKTRERDSYVVKQENLYIDCDYEQAADLKPKIKLFSQAIEEVRAVEIKYMDANGFISYRTIEPYTLVFKADAWYIYAMCKLRGDFRLFKLTRIRDARKTSRRFPKCDSKLIEKLDLEFYNEVYVDLELEFYSTVTESIVDWLGVSAVTDRGTKLFAAAEVPMTPALVKRLLSYGSSIKVLNPPELRDHIVGEAKRTLDSYGK